MSSADHTRSIARARLFRTAFALKEWNETSGTGNYGGYGGSGGSCEGSGGKDIQR
jgi:hypothetical protein